MVRLDISEGVKYYYLCLDRTQWFDGSPGRRLANFRGFEHGGFHGTRLPVAKIRALPVGDSEMNGIRIVIKPLLAIVCLIIATDPLSANDKKTAKVPNLYLDVSATVINTLVRRSIDQTERFKDEIQDTPVEGVGRTIGTSGVQLIPNSKFGVMDVVFNGNIYSRSIGYRPHTMLYSSTNTNVEVRRRVVIDSKGLRVFDLPGKAEATTTLDDVKSYAEPDVLAQRVMRFLFERTKAAAEDEAANKMAQRVSKRLGDEMTPILKAATAFGKSEFEHFKGRGLAIDSLEFSTTANALHTELRLAIPESIVIGPRPTMTPNLDLGLLAHPSLMNEAARIAVGGREFPLSEIKKFYDEVTLGLLRDGRKDAEKQDTLRALEKVLTDFGGKQTVIVLAKNDPLTVTATENGYIAEIHIGSIKQNDTTRYAGMRARAKYRLENTDDSPQAEREGAIEYLPGDEPTSDGKKLNAQPVAFTLLRGAIMEEVLKQRLALVLPQVEAIPDLRFYAPRGGVRNGWLALAWTLRPAEKK